MKKELAKVNEVDDLIVDYANTFLKPQGLNQNEIKQFIEISKGFGLNPFKREIYAIKYGSKCNILVGYEVYLKRAERSGQLNGWGVELKGQGKDMKAIITIYRKDWSQPFIHEVYFTEYTQNNQIWNSKPRTMLRKVAISQGFRLAFSEDCGGLPYSSEELPDIKSDDKPQALEDKISIAKSYIESAKFKEDLNLIDKLLKELALTIQEKNKITPLYLKVKDSLKYENCENDPDYQKFSKSIDEVVDAKAEHK